MSALTAANIEKFVAAWFYALDIHAPVAECQSYLASRELEMIFPERILRSYADFSEWLAIIYQRFFDENHNVQSVVIQSINDTTANLEVIVGWQASWFIPPNAKSKRTSMDAYQSWVIQTSDLNPYGLVIVKYYVDRFAYAPGFSQL
jgi:hypothetical protein